MTEQLKYQIPLTGKWARGVYSCPHCDYELPNPADIYKHIIGIAVTNFGKMKICECPMCFEKYYSHASNSDINLLHHYIKDGKNIHIKRDE